MIDRVERGDHLLLALAGPGLMLLGAAALVLIAALGGYEPLAAPEDLTLAEAAAIHDGAEVLRQIRAGADPNARVLVRRGMVSDPEFLLTPLEAATAAEDADVVRLLVRNGAAITASNYAVLYCLAVASGAPDVAAFLQGHAPPDAATACETVRLPL